MLILFLSAVLLLPMPTPFEIPLAFLTALRPWLIFLSVVLLGVGFWQQRRAKRCSVRGRWLGNVLLCAAVIVVVGMILFPQQIAAFIADRF
jgi:hypothetical protein